MANTRSAEKRIRQTKKRTLRNKAVKSRIRTAIRRFREALAAGDLEQIKKTYQVATSALDKAAQKGIIHRNAANRRKSRFTLLLNKAQKTSEQGA